MRGRAVWPWIWAALGIALVVRTGIRDRGVITDHLEFGRRVLLGLDLYAPFAGKPLHPPYPPGFGLLTAPFALLPERAARFAWGSLQVAALAVVGWWLRATLLGRWPELRQRAQWCLALTALIGARYVLRDTHGGGGNLVNLALGLGALGLAERGRPLSGGLLLGVSLATKPTQVLLLPLLWLFGWRRAALSALGAAAAGTAASLVLLRQGLAPLEQWLIGTLAYAGQDDLFATPAHGFPEFTWMNQCLRCALARWLGEVPPALAGQVPLFVPGLGLAAERTALIARVAGLALLATTALVAWRKRADRAWIWSAVLALSLLLSPIAWKAHHVALLPAFFLVTVRGFLGARWAWALLGGYAALCLLGEDLTGKSFKELQQSVYVVTAGTLVLWGTCLGCARTVPELGSEHRAG